MGVISTTGLFSGGTALHPAVGEDGIPEVKEVWIGCRIDCRNELHGLGHAPLLPTRYCSLLSVHSFANKLSHTINSLIYSNDPVSSVILG